MMSHYEHMTRLPETSDVENGGRGGFNVRLEAAGRSLIYPLTCLCRIRQVMRA